MPRLEVELLRVVIERETAHVVFEAGDADEARRLALEHWEDRRRGGAWPR